MARKQRKDAKGRRTAHKTQRKAPKRPASTDTGHSVGSRRKIEERFVAAIAADFEKHGVETIKKVRAENPAAYLRIVADLLPKDVNLKHDSPETFVNLLRAISGGELPSRHGKDEGNGVASVH